MPARPRTVIPDLDVERRERLVQDEHLGVGREGAGQSHPLRLPPGELHRVPARQVVELEPLEPWLGGGARDGATGSPHAQTRTRRCRAP